VDALSFLSFLLRLQADMFSSVQDFGRAYGTLTWNLSKVIPRKVGAVW
jgi:hypothetical protein